MEQSRVLAALSALAHDVRLNVVRILACKGETGMCAGGLAARLEMSASGVSFHLAALEKAGLVVAQREGRHIRYRLNADHMGAVFSFVVNDCCGDSPTIRQRCLGGTCQGHPLDGPPELTTATGYSGKSNT